MQLYQLEPTLKKKEKKRIGRGGKRGTYSGKGMKGQKSRAGRKLQPSIRIFIKRYPKKRGYKFKSIQIKPIGVNVAVLEKNFKAQSKINPQALLNKNIIRRMKGRMPLIKLLGKGTLEKSFIIEGCETSISAKAKIEKAGGKVSPLAK